MSAEAEFEDRLVRSLTRAGAGFETDPAPLIASGLALGRRAERRRRRRAVVGGVAMVVLVAAGGALTAGSGSGFGDGGRRQAGPVGASETAGPVDGVGVDVLVSTLRGLLPKGKVSGADGRTGSFGAVASAHFDDGRGVSGLVIDVRRYGGARRLPARTPGCVAPATCRSSRLADGSTLVLTERKPVGALPLTWSGELIGADGRLVRFTEFNAPDDQGSPVSRPEPPLTMEQVGTLVSDPAWGRIAQAVPVAQAYHVPVQFTGQQILDTVGRLLSSGLTRRTVDTSDGFASLTVDDGRGRSLVQLNVDDWGDLPAQEGTDEPKEVLGWDKLPDGTRIVTHDGGDPAAEGGRKLRARSVEVLRPNGLRVAVSAINSPGHGQDATRTDPPLTIDQLKAIALSPDWKLTLN